MFTGLVAELPIGQAGLTGSRNQALIRPEHLLLANNISFFGDNLSKEGGASKYNASALTGAPSVRGGYDWWPNTTTQRAIVVTSVGAILKDSGGGTFGTTLKSGLTININDVPQFVEGGKEVAANNRKLFIFTPNNQVQVLSGDGATTANIATPPADWSSVFPVTGCLHQGRLIGAGNSNDPHRVYYTGTSNHEDFSAGGSITCYPGEGEGIVKVMSFKGLILLFKFPYGIFYIDARDANPANWRVDKLNAVLGAAGPGCPVQLEDDVLFLDPQGNLHFISSTTEYGNLNLRSLTTEANFQAYVKDNFALAGMPRARGVLYPRKREVHFAVTGTGSTVNNLRMVVDLNRSPIARFRVSDRDVCESLWLRKDSSGVPSLASGDNAGFMWLMDSDTKSKDGAGYAAEFQSSHDDLSWLDPSFAYRRKQGRFLELVVEPLGNWNLDVQYYWDGKLAGTATFNMGVTGAALGSFTIGTDILGNNPIANRKRRITGSGRRFSIKGNNSGAAQDYSVSRFLLHFQPMDERLEA